MELSKNTFRIVSVIMLLFFIGMFLSVIYECPTVTLVLLSVCLLLGCWFWSGVRISSPVALVPANKITILGYEMKEVLLNGGKSNNV